jgi:hypothetical protein
MTKRSGLDQQSYRTFLKVINLEHKKKCEKEEENMIKRREKHLWVNTRECFADISNVHE